MQIRHILLPTDFSDCANLALKHGVYLAQEHGAKLTLFHVVVPHLHDAEPEESFPGERKLNEILAEVEADSGKSEPRKFGVERVVVRSFSPRDEILDFAENNDVDLIVMGTHSRSGLHRVLIGSETERVLRLSSCPVLTLSCRKGSHELPIEYRNILVAFDFSDSADEALNYGLEIASRYGASVDLVHVFDEPVVPPPLMAHSAAFVTTDPSLMARCRDSMDTHIEKAKGKLDVKVEKHVLEGRVAQTLRDFAKKRKSDLLVIGSRGLSGLDHILLGSVASRVLRISPCPVLAVHGTDVLAERSTAS